MQLPVISQRAKGTAMQFAPWSEAGLQFIDSSLETSESVDLEAVPKAVTLACMGSFTLASMTIFILNPRGEVLVGRNKLGDMALIGYEITNGTTYEVAAKTGFTRMLGGDVPFRAECLQALPTQPVLLRWAYSLLDDQEPCQSMVALFSYNMGYADAAGIRDTHLRTDHQWVMPATIAADSGYESGTVCMTQLFLDAMK